MDTRRIAVGKNATVRYETHVHPADRRRFGIVRDSGGRFVSVVHLSTVRDNDERK
jgi:hypothetical protein